MPPSVSGPDFAAASVSAISKLPAFLGIEADLSNEISAALAGRLERHRPGNNSESLRKAASNAKRARVFRKRAPVKMGKKEVAITKISRSH